MVCITKITLILWVMALLDGEVGGCDVINTGGMTAAILDLFCSKLEFIEVVRKLNISMLDM